MEQGIRAGTPLSAAAAAGLHRGTGEGGKQRAEWAARREDPQSVHTSFFFFLSVSGLKLVVARQWINK